MQLYVSQPDAALSEERNAANLDGRAGRISQGYAVNLDNRMPHLDIDQCLDDEGLTNRFHILLPKWTHSRDIPTAVMQTLEVQTL
ncbi:MAG: hypothetical protein EOP48_33460 [Sphingobacteriales bacterium]|jgi:hypothetical protein|nr:MAG: hypothetical protein EOP48_33460 [Sphingobacteriales bacterium]